MFTDVTHRLHDDDHHWMLWELLHIVETIFTECNYNYDKISLCCYLAVPESTEDWALGMGEPGNHL